MRSRIRNLALLVGLTTLAGCALLGGGDVTTKPGGRPSLNVYLSIPSENAIRVVSVTDRRFVTSFPVGVSPANIAVNPRPDREYLYSANAGDGTVSFVNLRSRVVEQAVQTGTGPNSGPWGIDVTGLLNGKDQFLFVTNRNDRTVSRISVEGRTVRTTALPRADLVPQGVVAAPTAAEAYVFANSQSASDSVIVKIGPAGEVAAQLTVTGARQLWRGALSGNSLYVTDAANSNLYRVDVSTFNSVTPIALGRAGATDVVVDPSGKSAFVAIPNPQVSGSTPDKGVVAVVDLTTSSSNLFPVDRGTFNEASQPQCLAINNAGTELWVGLSNRLGLYGAVTPGASRVLADDLQAVSYAPAGGQAPPIADIICGPGIQ
ncbi:MAG: YncE family protein [bacterium]|nr:YncE family protein [bacterium]